MLGEYSEEKAQDVIDKENRVDVYDDKITAYLTKLSSENLSYKDSLQVTSLLHCITVLAYLRSLNQCGGERTADAQGKSDVFQEGMKKR